ncbi:MICOS complex subunit MIC27 isoform X2 [Zophobas morio]|uniref:MICOS complex subunit MIC27 isoform X2 n=1 Tax=Zophobas morio TaxID=2755281 RepID=UPI003083669D
MYTRKLLNTLFVPAAVLVAEERGKDSSQQGQYCRASELPIYVPDPPPPTPEPEVAMPTYLENGFGAVRQQVTNISREVSAYKRVAVDYVEQSKDNAEGLLQYLRQEDNTTPKAGAIVIGGLTGYILGLRGRFIKRTLYASAGALGMAALCYPKEASEYSQIAIAEAKKYATIAYNFAYGGDDTQKAHNKTEKEK